MAMFGNRRQSTLGDLLTNAVQAHAQTARQAAQRPAPRAAARAYRPPVSERIGNALAPLIGREGGHSLGYLLRDWTPIGNIEGVLADPSLRSPNALLSALPIPGPARRGIGAGVSAITRDSSQRIARENYTVPVSRYTPSLYRETSMDQAQHYMPHANSSTDMRRELYFSDTPDLALGQGSNRGVLMEFDSSDLTGQVSRAKPGWDYQWDQGMGEYVLRHNNQGQYRGALRSVTIKPDAATDRATRERMRRILQWHEQHGWTRTVGEDGAITLRRPD